MKQKNIIFILYMLTILSIAACNKNEKDVPSEEKSGLSESKEVVYNVSSFLNAADTLSGKAIKIEGIVDHICKHSAKRFKIIDEEGKHDLKIEMSKELPAFNPANVGKKVLVIGKVISTKLYLKDIEKREKQILKNHEEEKETEHFEEEIKLVREVKKNINSGKISYHTIYHIEAISYDVLSK